MNSKEIKDDKLRKKAEEILQNQFNPVKERSKDADYVHELHVHQIELEIQNQELREAKIKLEDSRRKYFDLYNFAPVGYFTLDKDGIILDVNLTGASLLRVEKLNLQKKAFIQYIDPQYRNKFHHHTRKVLETKTKQTVELKLIKTDNNSFYAQFETININDENGNFKEFGIAVIDIIAQKKAETALSENTENNKLELNKLIVKLKNSNSELQQFAYVSSHDLKEPLRMITSFLQLLQKRYADELDEDANDFINYAVEGAKRMDMMINDLLEYSKIESQEREFKYIQSEKILETVLINLNPLINDTNAIITHDQLPLIYTNDQLMIQLFQNLIANAIKYHSEKIPEIHISANKSDNKYIFTLKDNGIGIKPKHLERIFTIFQRLHTREEYEGSGIGLAISKKIIQKHRGKIWAESELGKGSTFYFTIPIT
jgi:chemotaxis family two-component system sensor kinase Cph1